MSFASMPLYTGDYLRDTRHLTPLRHGIYLLALMHCWDSKGPMPLDEQECAGICNARSADEIDAMRYVINRYFVRMDDGHYNKRMSEEVAKFERLSRTFSAAGLKSAEVRRDKAREGARQRIEGRLNLGSTKAEPRSVSPSPSPTPTSIHTTEVVERGVQRGEIAPARKRAVAPSCPDDVDQQVWSDWLALRKAKKAPVTETVVRSAIAEAAKAGMTLESFLRVWCARGSQGLQADWLKPHERGGNASEPAWRTEQRERMQQFAPFSHAKRPPAAEPTEIINANAKRLD